MVLAATILASAMAFIDGSVVMIALPAMQRDLGASFQDLQWIVNGYTLMLGALILLGGGLGDRYGRRKVFLAGTLLFGGASLICALAPGAASLIGGRVLQGIGAALLVPQSLAIIAASFPKELRGRAIGTWAGSAAMATALGPPLGGFLIDALSWRVAFWINLPLAAATLWLCLRYVPESRDEAVESGLDWPGAALAALALGALTYGLTQLADPAGQRALGGGLLLAGAIGLVGFVLVERRARNPLVPPALFGAPTFTAANILTLFLYGALGGILFLLPFDLIGRRGLTAAEVGLTMLPLGLLIGSLSRPAGKLADRLGPRPLLAAGSALVTTASLLLAWGAGDYWLGVALPILLMAAGLAAAVTPLTTAVMNAVPEIHSGAASGVNNAASRLAGLFAVVILGATANLLFAWQRSLPQAQFGGLPALGDPARPALEAAFRSAYGGAMTVAALWALLATLVALLLWPRPAVGTVPPGPG